MAGEVLRETTRFGFRYGPAEVVRCSEHKGDVVVMVQGAREAVSIRVTPSGLVRVGPVQEPLSAEVLS